MIYLINLFQFPVASIDFTKKPKCFTANPGGMHDSVETRGLE